VGCFDRVHGGNRCGVGLSRDKAGQSSFGDLWTDSDIIMDWHLLYDFMAGFSLLFTGIFWIVFGFFSMRKIERGIVSEGKPRPCQWDPVWGRAIFYAWSVSLPNSFFSTVEDRILNTADVKRYANTTDKILAWMLMISSHTMLGCIIVGWSFNLY
jgi:hypothetical protein